jgi:protein SCO1/2
MMATSQVRDLARRLTHLLALTAAGATFQATAAVSEPTTIAGGWDRGRALAYSQAAIGRALAEYSFIDQNGNPYSLAQARGRPLIVNLVYTSCHHVCPTLTNALARAVAMARDAFGRERFSVITIGFDTANDTPQRMASFASARRIDTAAWPFLAGDAATVGALARDLGFIYERTSVGFDHLAQISIIGADGRVYRQVYGSKPTPPEIVEPLKELLFGQPAPDTSGVLERWWQGIRLFCTVYDPAAGRYQFDYSVFMALLAGTIALGGTLVFVVKSWRATTRATRRAA